MASRRRRQTRNWTKDGAALGIGAGIAAAAFVGYAWLTPSAGPLPPPAAKVVGPAPAPVKAVAGAPSPATPPPEPAMLTVKRVLPIDGPIRYGDWHWDDADVPKGPLVVTVDLDAETLSVFRDGYEIGATAILYGADEKPTPLGTYPITQKDRDHRSTTYGGAPMPYMLRLTGDGVSIHGSKVEVGAATHGCIGVPIPFAAKLFATARIGDRVIVTRGKRLDVGSEIAPAA